ncbi:Emp65p Ecym_2350 [Eremothecium cymbalariae DBVPG|uniref:Uncharacterized protein n=1 Tax=Eremothecium cymbalariae (strain CBS 270.75 / DBVPG 7215 / KCTC 17166 / NRRL Y-17582) TaxID=931890 RepID=G8JNL6_ERECY|nr:Hypothetical protein Ecym_2350 [Eremothecium cymbalariae DBVPG\
MPKKQCQVQTKPQVKSKRGPVNKFRNFLINEIGPLTSRSISDTLLEENEAGIENDLELIINMVKLPIKLEKFFLFSLLASLDCFMYYFTIVPLRLVHGLTKRDRYQKVIKEVKMLSLILVSSFVLLHLDTSRVYHKIKGQSAVKLYMMFQVLEMCDKMLSSFGQNLFSTVIISKTTRKHTIREICLFVATLGYLIAHVFILIYQTIALNVAVNSYSNSLLTLILSMQFAELKASVFKRFDKEGLFQLAIADIVERFQLLTFLTIIALRNIVATGKSISHIIPNSWRLPSTSSIITGVLYGPVVTVIGSEILVDWIKHGYVTKFNCIRPHLYDRFLQILYHDHQNNLREFQLRIGLPIPALVVLFIVLVSPTISQGLISASTSSMNTVAILVLGFLCLVLAKFILQAILLKWVKASQPLYQLNTDIYVPGSLSSGIGKVDEQMRSTMHSKRFSPSSSESTEEVKKAPPNPSELRLKKDVKHPHSLESVGRFKMVSKRIW